MIRAPDNIKIFGHMIRASCNIKVLSHMTMAHYAQYKNIFCAIVLYLQYIAPF